MFAMSFLVLSSKGEGAKVDAAGEPVVSGDTVKFVHSNGVQTAKITKKVTGDAPWNLNLVNDSSSNMTINVTFTFEKVSGARRPTVQNAASEWSDLNTTNTNPFSPGAFTINRGEIYPIRVYYSGSNTGVTNVTATIEATARKDYPTTGNTEETAVKVDWGGTLEGPCTYASKYYTFTLDQPADVTIKESITSESKRTDLNLYEAGEYDYKKSSVIKNGEEVVYPLAPGTYYIEVCTLSQMGDTLNEYGLTITKVDYNWPVPKLTWQDTVTQGNRSYDLSCSIVDDGTGTEISGWGLNNDNRDYDSFLGAGKTSFDAEYTLRGTDHGWYTLTITLRNENYGSKAYTYDLCVKLHSPDHITYKSFSSTTNTILLQDLTKDRTYEADYYKVEMYKSGKWQTLSSKVTNSYKISKLKSASSYKIRVSAYDPKGENDKSDMSSSPKTFTIKTGVTTKPVIQKVSASKAKYRYIKKVWHPGYWSSLGHWYDGYYTGGYYVTDYKVTVTLKKSIKNTSGLSISHGGDMYRAKGTGKTFSYTVTARGKQIGRNTPSIKVRTYRNADYGAYGPYSSSKKAKIKK